MQPVRESLAQDRIMIQTCHCLPALGFPTAEEAVAELFRHPAGRQQRRIPRAPINIAQYCGLGAHSKTAPSYQDLWPKEAAELVVSPAGEWPDAVCHGSDKAKAAVRGCCS